jgi:hypothetical protein
VRAHTVTSLWIREITHKCALEKRDNISQCVFIDETLAILNVQYDNIAVFISGMVDIVFRVVLLEQFLLSSRIVLWI